MNDDPRKALARIRALREGDLAHVGQSRARGRALADAIDALLRQGEAHGVPFSTAARPRRRDDPAHLREYVVELSTALDAARADREALERLRKEKRALEAELGLLRDRCRMLEEGLGDLSKILDRRRS